MTQKKSRPTFWNVDPGSGPAFAAAESAWKAKMAKAGAITSSLLDIYITALAMCMAAGIVPVGFKDLATLRQMLEEQPLAGLSLLGEEADDWRQRDRDLKLLAELPVHQTPEELVLAFWLVRYKNVCGEFYSAILEDTQKPMWLIDD